jgi:lipopolysaccharide transport system permease protein
MRELVQALRVTWHRRALVRTMAAREVRDRHAGQLLGATWAFGHPLLLMFVYTFLFAYVFPTRLSSSDSNADFAVSVLAGLIPWLAFQDVLARASSNLAANASLVKQIVFPNQILPLKTTLASVVPYVTGLAFLLGFAAFKGTWSAMILLTPVLVLISLVAMAGAGYLLASLGVFFKDLRDIVVVFCSVNLFAQPILYNPQATLPWLDKVLAINPFSHLVWMWQDVFFYQTFAHPLSWLIFPSLALLTLIVGLGIFLRLQPHFGDAL